MSFLDGAASAPDVPSFMDHLAARTHVIVAGDFTAVNLIDLKTSSSPHFAFTDCARARLEPQMPTFEAYIPEHPLIAYHDRTGDGRAVQLGDFLSDREFRELGLYRDCFRHVDVHEQAAIALVAGDSELLGVAINREHRDFSAREIELLDAIRLNLRTAFQTVQMRERLRELEALGSRAHVIRFLEKRSPQAPRFTPREREIVTCLFEGRSDGDIAELLCISRRTVQKHLEHIYEKLDVRTRSAVIAKVAGA